jgi:hypothetical protein
MNNSTPYQSPQQSFPTDVTAPAPTQLRSPKPEPKQPPREAPTGQPQPDRRTQQQGKSPA